MTVQLEYSLQKNEEEPEAPKDKDIVTEQRCNTPVLTLFALNVYNVYIVINHGVELREKSPPLI